ncbi:hypothetical protein H7X46_13610 [Pseudonocardia sp. C8]|uniref:hypothetical protein n=1 Tax=Pseudonocardia sp. C8 TaxID=2762759 RepID=UPI00164273D7|nr:hypothetical protein [Pseudonocardia sp. C8]MBC3192104.1 hypothetical protein [Pseudonocardia sp. C8]
MLRTAAVLCWVLAAGFGLLDVVAIAHTAGGGGVWTFFGYPTYGRGPFEDAGLPTTVPLLAGFLLVAVAEAVVGVLLWRRRRSGVVGALLLLPFELAYWIGFALPAGPVLGVVRTVLVLRAARAGVGPAAPRA